MPLTKSAKKALRSSTKKAAVNAYMKVSMKNATKVATKAIKDWNKDSGILLIEAQKRIDKAAKKNIISKKSASRKISALMSSASGKGVETSKIAEKKPSTPKKVMASKKTTSAKKKK